MTLSTQYGAGQNQEWLDGDHLFTRIVFAVSAETFSWCKAVWGWSVFRISLHSALLPSAVWNGRPSCCSGTYVILAVGKRHTTFLLKVGPPRRPSSSKWYGSNKPPWVRSTRRPWGHHQNGWWIGSCTPACGNSTAGWHLKQSVLFSHMILAHRHKKVRKKGQAVCLERMCLRRGEITGKKKMQALSLCNSIWTGRKEELKNNKENEVDGPACHVLTAGRRMEDKGKGERVSN